MVVYVEFDENIVPTGGHEEEFPGLEQALNAIRFEYNKGYRSFFIRVE